MIVAFYTASTIAIVATVMAISRSNAVHGLLYFVISLLSVAVVFLTLGAPLAGVFEVMIYAGAIMVLFIFVVMMMTTGPLGTKEERGWMPAASWIGPILLTAILTYEVAYLFLNVSGGHPLGRLAVDPGQVATTLLGTYLLAVELVSMLLLLGLVGAYHLAHDLREGKVRKRVASVGGSDVSDTL
jgi:NADH-quinone oxidoreductase subunit J